MGVTLQPIVFCGHGSNLYPLCDAAAETDTAAAKALLPVGNRPLLAFALQNVLSAGLTTCIVLAPSWQHAAIQKALSQVRLSAPAAILSSSKSKASSAGRQVSISFGLPRAQQEAAATSSATNTLLSSPSEEVLYVELLPLGPHDGAAESEEAQNTAEFRTGRLGTAELLRWVAQKGCLRNADPLVLPVDLVGPAFALRDLIDVYIQAQATHVEAPTACCALYERGAGVGLGKERDKEGPSRLISAASNDNDGSPAKLAFLRDSDMTSDMEIRRSLLQASPRTRISTRLLDAHVYIFNRAQVLPLLEGNPRLTSLRDHVLPLIAKASWQAGLSEKAGWSLGKTKADADETSSTDSEDVEGTRRLDALAHSSVLQREALRRSTRTAGEGTSASLSGDMQIRCLAHIVRLQSGDEGSDERSFVVRANTLATYIESNRWLLRQTSRPNAGLEVNMPLLAGREISTTGAGEGVSATAQIAPDAIVGHNVMIGDRASVRASVIGDGCEIARGVKLNNCILLPGAKVGENARLEGTIVCSGADIGAQCILVDCDVGSGVHVEAQTTSKHEKLVGEHDDDDEDEIVEETDSEDD